ncbi:MAG: cation:proton antiporter [Cytophagales bacterium]|nr:MAG: cation:proton antiporter [Cytophagales bacterium]
MIYKISIKTTLEKLEIAPMKALSHHDIIILLLQVSIMLLLGKILGELFKKLKQPAVVGEILAGLILGPTILGALAPEVSNYLFPATGNVPVALHGLTSLSVVLLLLTAGLEVELSLILGQKSRALATSLSGIALSFVLGFSAPYVMPNFFTVVNSDTFIFALFLGTALSITALPVIVRTLMDLGIFKTKTGMLIIASAMIDDFIGWMIFSVILGLIKQNNSFNSIGFTIGGTVLFAVLMLTVGRRFIDKILPLINHHLSFPGGILAFVIILAVLAAAFTESIGIHAIFGSFIVGVALSDSLHMSKKTKEIIHDFVSNIFAPLFFVSIGLKINFINNFDFSLVALVMAMAFFGKIIGCSSGNFIINLVRPKHKEEQVDSEDKRKLLIRNIRTSLAVGFGMNARGAMEIILASLALQFGVIDEFMFVALVVMALVTSVISGYMMKILLPKEYQNNQTNGIIIFGNNSLSRFIGKYLQTQEKIPVLVTDFESSNSKKQEAQKNELSFYEGNITDKEVVEKLDLSRYNVLLALSENEKNNQKICNLFEYEFTGSRGYRLITKSEANIVGAGEELADGKNILFRNPHWHYNNLEKVVEDSLLEIVKSDFESKEQLNKFLRFNLKLRTMIPLFIKRKNSIEPVTSESLDIEKGDVLVYLDIKTPPKSRKPSNEEQKIQNSLTRQPNPNGQAGVDTPLPTKERKTME